MCAAHATRRVAGGGKPYAAMRAIADRHADLYRATPTARATRRADEWRGACTAHEQSGDAMLCRGQAACRPGAFFAGLGLLLLADKARYTTTPL